MAEAATQATELDCVDRSWRRQHESVMVTTIQKEYEAEALSWRATAPSWSVFCVRTAATTERGLEEFANEHPTKGARGP